MGHHIKKALKVIGSIFHENCEFTFVTWITFNEMETVVVFKKYVVEESQMTILKSKNPECCEKLTCCFSRR